MNEDLQKQINELKATIELLQNGGVGESISQKLARIRKQAIEKYYGNWQHFRSTDIQICPKDKTWSDMEYLRTGMERLMNIMYKHGRDISNSATIAGMVMTVEDLKEYEEIASYVVDTMVEKIWKLRDRHDVGRRERDEAVRS